MSERTFDVSRPPTPVPGCPACTTFAKQRAAAQAEFDRSRATDMNVLMRRHQQQEHTR